MTGKFVLAEASPPWSNDTTLHLVLLILTGLSLAHIIHLLYRAWSQLGPTHNTRHSQAKRTRAIVLFATLAVVSLLIHVYLFNQHAVAKVVYQAEEVAKKSWKQNTRKMTWAVHKGFGKAEHAIGVEPTNPLPNSMPGRAYVSDVSSVDLKYILEDLRNLLSPQKLYASMFPQKWVADQGFTFEALVMSSRSFLWTQQWALGYAVWSIFVGTEVSLRRLPRVTGPCIVFLAWTLGLSCAQNLFYILILMAPARPPKRASKVPLLPLHVLPFLWMVASVMTAPRQVDYAIFPYMCGAMALLPVLLLICGSTLTTSFPNIHVSYEQAKKLSCYVWCTFSLLCLALHLYTSISAVIEYLPPERKIWHVVDVFNYHHQATKSERVGKSLLIVLSGLGDHPVVNAIGWDVIMSAISLCCWAVVGAVDVGGMLKCSLWPWVDETVEAAHRVADATAVGAHHLAESVADAQSGTFFAIRYRMARIRSLLSGPQVYEWMDLEPPEDVKVQLRQPKKRGRPRKEQNAAKVSGYLPDDGVHDQHSRRRSTSGRRSSSRARRTPERYVEGGDEYYVRPSRRASAVAEAARDVAVEGEAAALAWGLFAVGGLGMAVFGAEAT